LPRKAGHRDAAEKRPTVAALFAGIGGWRLRGLVNYFTSFTFLMTLGYACALVATFESHWTGNRNYIAAVRLFWPMLYVPA
jgi:hypothetical protein